MKKILIILLVISLFLTACGGSEEQTTTTPTSEVSEPAVKVYNAPSVKEEDTAVPVRAEGGRLDPSIQKLIDKAESITSLEYDLSKHVENSPDQDYFAVVFLKGDAMKHILPDRSARYRADESKYDTVYFNLADNTARGYCETAFKCGEDFNTDPVDLITTSFLIETPLDVIATLSSSAVESGSAMIGGKEVRIIEDTYKGMIRRTHIWSYRGIPLRYELYTAKGEKAAVIVEYEGLSVNGVKAVDVTP